MTGTSVITSALRLIGRLRAPGQTPSTPELAEGLESLNALLSLCSEEQGGIFQITRESIAMTGAASYTLSTRAVRIVTASVLATSGVQRPVGRIVTAEEWTQIRDDGRTGDFADLLFPDYALSTTIRLWPKPGSGALLLYSLKALSSVASVGDAISLPPGYENWLVYGLAVQMAPRFGRACPPEVVAIAERSRGAIANTNAQLLAGAPVPIPPEVNA